MTGKSDYLENGLLLLIFNATDFGDIADNDATAPLTNLYVSLHTGDPTDSGDQTSNECAYTSYARVEIARTSGGWTVTNNSVSPASTISFPQATGGSEEATHWAVGTDTSGAGNLLYAGAISPNISISSGVTPQLTTSTAITED